MKRCSKCNTVKYLEHFSLRGDRPGQRRAECKKCHSATRKGWKAQSRETARFYKTQSAKRVRLYISEFKLRHGCVLCGYNDVAAALEFHHVLEKIRSINTIETFKSFHEEVVRCIVVCANCHREIHAGLWDTDDLKPLLVKLSHIPKSW